MRVDEAPALDFILPQLHNKLARLTLNVGPYPSVRKYPQPDDVLLYIQPVSACPMQMPIALTQLSINRWQRNGKLTSQHTKFEISRS